MDDNSHNDDAVAAAAAAAAAAHQLGLSDLQSSQHQHHHEVNPHHFQLQQPDFSQNIKDDSQGDVDVDVHGLDIPTVEEQHNLDLQQGLDMGDHDDEGLDLGMEHSLGMTPEMEMETTRSGSYGRPPSIRKACDLCHAAKQVGSAVSLERTLEGREKSAETDTIHHRNVRGIDRHVQDVKQVAGNVFTRLDNDEERSRNMRNMINTVTWTFNVLRLCPRSQRLRRKLRRRGNSVKETVWAWGTRGWI